MNARTPGLEIEEAVPSSMGGTSSTSPLSASPAAPPTSQPTSQPADLPADQPAPASGGAAARPTTPSGRPAREPRPVDPVIEELWREFKAGGDPDVRERLILHYSPLVKYVAGRVGVGLPPNIEQADLVSYGIFGLIDAIEKFDIGRAIKFETYAISRIKGAII